MKSPKRPGSFVTNGVLASGVLFYAVRLSASGRSAIDYVVIGLIVCTIAYNIVQLSRRLHRSGGNKAVWRVQRTILFWVVGLLNTALLRPEHLDSWRHWLGWALLLVAAADTVALFFMERASITTSRSPS